MQLWPAPPTVAKVLPIQVFGQEELSSTMSVWLPSAVLLWTVFPIAPEFIKIPLSPLLDTVLFCRKLYWEALGSVGKLTEFTLMPWTGLLTTTLPENAVPVRKPNRTTAGWPGPHSAPAEFVPV